jgi:heat shock protein HslJ
MTTMTPTMTRTICDQELLALERQYWDALKGRDPDNRVDSCR